MGCRVGTARRGSIKAAAVTLAAFFGAVGPGISPLIAVAQDEPRPPWAPPTNVASKPKDSGGPDTEYLKRVECVTTATKGHQQVEADVIKDIPWGQAHLRLSEAHDYVRAKSRHGKIGVDEASGKPLKVAVIDTGVTPHAFFQGRVKAGGDYVQKNGEGEDGLLDCDGHGTQVAGIIGGNPNNPDVGFIGVAPDIEIISIRQSSQNYSEKTEEEIEQERKEATAKRKQAADEARRKREAAEAQKRIDDLKREVERSKNDDDSNGGSAAAGSPDGRTAPGQDGGQGDPRAQGNSSGAGNQETLAEAIVRAVDKHKVDVINMSVDACRPNSTGRTSQEAKLQAAIRHAVDEDVVVVAAAGNKGGSCQQNDTPAEDTGLMPDPNNPRTIVTPPWFSDDLLAVAAIDESGSVADFSMRGPWVSVAAPGTKIISLDPARGSSALVNVMFNGESAEHIQGTSFASPYVAGLAALVRQLHPDLDAREVMERIKTTAQHPGATGGHDQFIGYGVIDPMAALTATLPSDIGADTAEDIALPSDMPPPGGPDKTPMIVALAGSGGAIGALGITLFVVHTIRRNRTAE
ncbi:MAG: S8 family serine peptidase [Actinophytocola sp.]|nr:S8 family serine peptidase [Actinophytocola sp.]